jgi:glycine/D-amino acid oxidase-like deaminating enzyme
MTELAGFKRLTRAPLLLSITLPQLLRHVFFATSLTGSLCCGARGQAEPSEAVVRRILERASQYLPAVAAEPSAHPAMQTRVGLRPMATAGAPRVGAVAGARGLWVAAGHEGSGLTLGLATGELIRHHVLREAAHALTVPLLLREAALSGVMGESGEERACR